MRLIICDMLANARFGVKDFRMNRPSSVIPGPLVAPLLLDIIALTMVQCASCAALGDFAGEAGLCHGANSFNPPDLLCSPESRISSRISVKEAPRGDQ